MTLFTQFDDLLDCARYGELHNIQQIIQMIDCSMLPEIFLRQDHRGITMLHLAAANNHEDIVLYILDHLKSVKAPEAINCQNEEGNTPLHWAAVNGNTNIVEILIRSGANPDVKNKLGRSAFSEAQFHGKESTASVLLDSVLIDEDY